MKITKTQVLSVIVTIETVVIALMIVKGYHVVVVKSHPIIASPLECALDFESSDRKFEELVNTNPKWVEYQVTDPSGAKHGTILSSCALVRRTNYVRILITHGADVEEAVKSLKKVEADDAIKLLRQVQSENSAKQ